MARSKQAELSWNAAGVLIGIGALVVGCGEPSSPAQPLPPLPPGRSVPTAPAQQESDPAAAIAALEAIGYAGGTQAIDPERATGVTLFDPERAQPGYNLLVSAHDTEVLLLDMRGETVHRWSCEFASIWPFRNGVGRWRKDCFRRARLLPGGELLAIWEGLGMVKLDRDSRVLWSFAGYAHHDLDVDDEGRVFVLTRKASVLPRFSPEQPILEDFVTVLSADGELLRSVSLIECFEDSPFEGPLRKLAKGGDVFHTNTLSLLTGRHAARIPEFTAGRVLVSLRRSHTLAVCDLEQRTVVWALEGDWRLQHEPVLLDSGNLMLFDNRGQRRRSGVLELDPASGELLWEYRLDEKDAFYTATCGVAQRLPNGNTLVSETEAGRAFEITPAGEQVWRYDTPFRWTDSEEQFVAAVFDMVRVPSEFVEGWLGR